MLKQLAFALLLVFAFTTMSNAQIGTPGSVPGTDFPAPTGPGSAQNQPAALAACEASVKHDQNGNPIRLYVRNCMYSKGYSMVVGTDCDFVDAGMAREIGSSETVADCMSSPDNSPKNTYNFHSTFFQKSVPPVAYDPAAPGPKLLLLVKKLADNGQLDDPASVTANLDLPLTLSVHVESGPTDCAANPPYDVGYDISTNYVIAGKSWYHPLPSGTILIVNPDRHIWGLDPAKRASVKDVPLGPPTFTYNVESVVSCPHPSTRDGVTASIEFDNIPAYACISDSLVRTIFPPGPANELSVVMDGDGPDFAYVHKTTSAYFSLVWPKAQNPVPGNQPNCLQTVNIGNIGDTYAFGPDHKSGLTGKYPMPRYILAALSVESARAQLIDPGSYFLKRVKALADNPRIGDPVTASAILHLPFILNHYRFSRVAACSDDPDSRDFSEADYGMASGAWFHALPTGKRLLFSPSFSEDPTPLPIDDPIFENDITTNISCTPSNYDHVDFQITFGNIPPYACISAEQIKTVFPTSHIPTKPEAYEMKPDLSYVGSYTWAEFYMATNYQSIRGTYKLAPKQPDCLAQVLLYPVSSLAQQKQLYAQMIVSMRTRADQRGLAQ